MSKKEVKTNAMRILDKENIEYIVHTYEVSDDLIDGVSVAKKCGQNPEQVFKTLVTVDDNHNNYVFVVPVAAKLDLKACAKAVGAKQVHMIPQKELFKLTGYIHGGCSPVGMKKLFVTCYDESVILFDKIMVSGGKVGVQIEIDPNDLIHITNGILADIGVYK